MNRDEAQNAINEVIKEAHKRQPLRKQYPVAKHQIATLTELGIIDLMPAKFGYMDAAMVIDAAQDKASAVFNASGEGEDVPASALNEALNETAATEVKVGDTVQVKPFTVISDLVVNAIVTPAKTRQHNGYRAVKVVAIYDDNVAGAQAEVEVGGMVDYVPLVACTVS